MSLARREPLVSSIDTASVGRRARQALMLEVRTWPKPGLVSHRDCGAHSDMDHRLFRRSAAVLEPFFTDLAAAGTRCAAMDELRVIGLAAEGVMFAATGGINTHRGAIFGLGLLAAAAGLRAAGFTAPEETLGAIVRRRWSDGILTGPTLLHSHGEHARRRYGAGGARGEAAAGFPSVYEVALPALRAARSLAPGDAEAARVQACFALIAELEDTNLLHRGGREGQAFARNAASSFLAAGGVGAANWRVTAASIHSEFIERRLSPGGAADLLAMALFVEATERSE